ncbi:MAG: Lpp/OprI family alanine-zipper lipoprotein [Pseudomonadota bacterium]
MRNLYKTLASGAMIVALASATGCATTGDLDALKAQVDKANSTASQAAADASAAKSDAAAAKAAAMEARDAANETNEKLDRMFKASMQK